MNKRVDDMERLSNKISRIYLIVLVFLYLDFVTLGDL